MDKLLLRPRYNLEVPYTAEEVIRRLKAEVDTTNGDVLIKVRQHHINLEIADKDKHYWSPELNLDVESSEDGKNSVLRGVCGPRQTIWLMFTFFYSFIIFAILVIAMFGLSMRSIGLSSRILYALPVLLFIIITMYLTSRYGQKLAHNQMRKLRILVNESMSTER